MNQEMLELLRHTQEENARLLKENREMRMKLERIARIPNAQDIAQL